MRRITLWALSTIAALVLAFSYRTSTMGAGGATTVAAATVPAPSTPDPATTGSPTTNPTTPGTPTPGTPTPSATKQPSATRQPSATKQSGSRTYQGTMAQTQWGPVQVTITVTDGRITDVAVPTYPNGNFRDQEINAYALPTLRQETLTAQSAGIDAVSGATVTSDGYKESLQSALDAANLK
jgi:uncharacterized protein with FMN-binding domain